MEKNTASFSVVHDNTSFTSIRSWAEGISDDTTEMPTDIANLLEIACSYIICDEILIPGFVHHKVAEKREYGIDVLENWGLDRQIFKVEENELEIEFQKRLQGIGLQIFGRFDTDKKGSIEYLSKPRVINKNEESHVKNIHGLLFHPHRQKALDSIKESPFKNGNEIFGAAGYTLATNPKLIDFFDKFKENWTFGWTQRFLDLQMLEKNHSFAEKKDSAYCSNYKRFFYLKDGMEYRKNNLLKLVIELIDSVAKKNQDTIDLPGLQRHLIIKSKGVPEKFWEEVIKLREEAIDFRKKLSQVKFYMDKKDDNIKWFELETEIKEYANELAAKQNIQYVKGASLNALGVPTLQFSFDGVKHKWKVRGFAKQYSLISEIVNSSMSPIIKEEYFTSLLSHGRRLK